MLFNFTESRLTYSEEVVERPQIRMRGRLVDEWETDSKASLELCVNKKNIQDVLTDLQFFAEEQQNGDKFNYIKRISDSVEANDYYCGIVEYLEEDDVRSYLLKMYIPDGHYEELLKAFISFPRTVEMYFRTVEASFEEWKEYGLRSFYGANITIVTQG